jgi:predicted NAD-dependent protein-ADP-ribosyltransferase YbiA (DUF1768 family)
MPRRESFKKALRLGTAVIGDGKCEKLYFDQMKTSENLTSNIGPTLPNNSGSWSTVFNTVDKFLLNEEYEQIYCLIDFDTVISKNETEKYTNRRNKLLKTGKVSIFECSPCFEMWFLMHYEHTAKPFDNCDSVSSYIVSKKYILDYCKTEEYYTKKRIYEHLKPKQQTAIRNAKLLESNREDVGIKYPRAEVYKLIEILLKK